LSIDEGRFRNIVALVASQEFDQIVAPKIENSQKDDDAVLHNSPGDIFAVASSF